MNKFQVPLPTLSSSTQQGIHRWKTAATKKEVLYFCKTVDIPLALKASTQKICYNYKRA